MIILIFRKVLFSTRKLTEADKSRLNRRIRYLRDKQKEAQSFRPCSREYGLSGAVQSRACYNEPRVFLFLGCPIEINRGSGGFQHISDTILGLFKHTNAENEANAELLELKG